MYGVVAFHKANDYVLAYLLVEVRHLVSPAWCKNRYSLLQSPSLLTFPRFKRVDLCSAQQGRA